MSNLMNIAVTEILETRIAALRVAIESLNTAGEHALAAKAGRALYDANKRLEGARLMAAHLDEEPIVPAPVKRESLADIFAPLPGQAMLRRR